MYAVELATVENPTITVYVLQWRTPLWEIRIADISMRWVEVCTL